MSTNITRRKFVVSLGALAAALPLGVSAFDFFPSAGNGFEFLLLGDLHYDKLEHHDMEYLKEHYPNDISQIENYSKITRESLPLLLERVKAKGNELNADFYLQLGDFLEGLCGSEELARKQTTDFISLIEEQDLKRPFFVIKGNHDISGEGAKETYIKTVLPWQSEAQKQAISTANSTFVHKNVRFILFDCYTADESVKWLKDVLAEHKEERLFFCVHQPIVPFNARANWHVYAKASQQQKREELLNLLGEHNAIVLCGHLHKTNILTRSTPKGDFVQICLGSIIPVKKTPVKNHLKGLDAYGPGLVDLEPNFSVSTLEERIGILENEKQYVKYFEYADFCGYATVSVDETKQVAISIYSNLETEPWRVVNLTDITLPIHLKLFTANVKRNSVQLTWVTSMERNNSHFELLRSEDGLNKEVIATVSGKGTSDVENTYSYEDVNAASGINFYQLRQVDYDGRSSNSKVISVNSKNLSKTRLSVFASQTQPLVRVHVNVDQEDAGARFQIAEIGGRKIFSESILLIKDENEINLQVNLQKGIYIASLFTRSEKMSVKFEK